MAPPTPSPHKPRLLWRGALHLPDGTALPGLAIVSSIQPAFSSFHQELAGDALAKPGDVDERLNEAAQRPPFTLSKEQQDELSLSIEMVRHAPLAIVDVVENVDRDQHGNISLPRMDGGKDQTRSSATIAAASTSNVHITFEAAGDVRMYIDPGQEATIAFFERLFVYDDLQKGDKGAGCARCAASAIVFSLDKSFKTASSELSDVFSDPSLAAQGLANGHASGAMEAVVIGIVRPTGDSAAEGTVELHVGKKVTRRATSLNPLVALASSQTSSAARAARPDDPAPRGLARFLSKPSKSSTAALQSRRSSDFALPPPPSLLRRNRSSSSAVNVDRNGCHDKQSDAAPANSRFKCSSNISDQHAAPSSPTSALKKRGGNHTPGRRGEKRPRCGSGLTRGPLLDPQERAVSVGRQVRHGDPSSMSNNSEISQPDGSIEERNRSLIKKLVHYQLLGKGVERQEDTYLACFGPTCQGALLALRKVVKEQPIDRQMAASIIERHLDMYL